MKVKAVKCMSIWVTHVDTSSSRAARRARKVLLRPRSRKNRDLNRLLFLREVKFFSFTQPGVLFLQQSLLMLCNVVYGWFPVVGSWVSESSYFILTNRSRRAVMPRKGCDGDTLYDVKPHEDLECLRFELHFFFYHNVPVISSSQWLLNLCLLINISGLDFACLFLKPGSYLEASEIWLCLGIQFHVQVRHTSGREVDIDGSEERKMPRADWSGVTLPFRIRHKDAGELGWIRSRWQSRLLPLCPCQQTFLLSQMFQLTNFTNFGRICMETLFSFLELCYMFTLG